MNEIPRKMGRVRHAARTSYGSPQPANSARNRRSTSPETRERHHAPLSNLVAANAHVAAYLKSALGCLRSNLTGLRAAWWTRYLKWTT